MNYSNCEEKSKLTVSLKRILDDVNGYERFSEFALGV